MAIQPIDLSVIYGQMDNVSKFNASQNQITQSLNQSNFVNSLKTNQEKSTTVQETKSYQERSNLINKDGRQNQNSGEKQEFQNLKEKAQNSAQNSEQENQQDKKYEIKDPRLGLHIDITG